MTDATDVADPSAQLVPSDAVSGELVQVDEQHPLAAEGHTHPGPRQYVFIGIILVVLTAIEVAVSYLDKQVNSNVLIFLLGCLAAMKFFLVCAWFMHMKQDAPFFRRLFIVGMVGATIVYGVALFTFASTVLKS